jgi:hypothetical protein
MPKQSKDYPNLTPLVSEIPWGKIGSPLANTDGMSGL